MPANEQRQQFGMCQYCLAFGASICDGKKGLSRVGQAYFTSGSYHGSFGTKMTWDQGTPNLCIFFLLYLHKRPYCLVKCIHIYSISRYLAKGKDFQIKCFTKIWSSQRQEHPKSELAKLPWKPLCFQWEAFAFSGISCLQQRNGLRLFLCLDFYFHWATSHIFPVSPRLNYQPDKEFSSGHSSSWNFPHPSRFIVVSLSCSNTGLNTSLVHKYPRLSTNTSINMSRQLVPLPFATTLSTAEGSGLLSVYPQPLSMLHSK